MNLYLDIETVPCDDPAIIAEIASTITPPGNYKKPETIAAWEMGEKKRAVEEAVNRTSFDGGYGKIICIGYAVNDNPAGVIVVRRDYDEASLIADWFESLDDNWQTQGSPSLTFVGHNIPWDLRMLYQRAVVHGIQPPAVLLKAMRAKPWDDCIADTMLLWDPSREKKISLDKLCKVLGITSPKGEVNGSMVAQLYRDGQIEKIAEYCKRDVMAVRECYKRLSFAEVA